MMQREGIDKMSDDFNNSFQENPREQFVSYAEFFEDVIIWRALKNTMNGFYIDIGPINKGNFSVTEAFYQRGWRGINVELTEERMNRLNQCRPRDKNVQLFFGRKGLTYKYWEFPKDDFLTFDDQMVDLVDESIAELVVPRLVQAVSWDALFESFLIEEIQLLRINVHGAELILLEGFDFNKIRPWIILISLSRFNSTQSTSEICSLLESKGYEATLKSGGFIIFSDRRRGGFIDQLRFVPNFWDSFVPNKSSSYFKSAPGSIERREYLRQIDLWRTRALLAEKTNADFKSRLSIRILWKLLSDYRVKFLVRILKGFIKTVTTVRGVKKIKGAMNLWAMNNLILRPVVLFLKKLDNGRKRLFRAYIYSGKQQDIWVIHPLRADKEGSLSRDEREIYLRISKSKDFIQ